MKKNNKESMPWKGLQDKMYLAFLIHNFEIYHQLYSKNNDSKTDQVVCGMETQSRNMFEDNLQMYLKKLRTRGAIRQRLANRPSKLEKALFEKKKDFVHLISQTIQYKDTMPVSSIPSSDQQRQIFEFLEQLFPKHFASNCLSKARTLNKEEEVDQILLKGLRIALIEHEVLSKLIETIEEKLESKPNSQEWLEVSSKAMEVYCKKLEKHRDSLQTLNYSKIMELRNGFNKWEHSSTQDRCVELKIEDGFLSTK